MRTTTLLMLLLLTCFACNKDDNETKSISCIDDYPMEVYDNCVEVETEVDICELIILEEKLISETAKDRFSDFCLETGSTISFVNTSNETMVFTIDRRVTFEGAQTKGTLDTIPACKAYCMNNETVILSLKSEDISLYFSMRTEFDFEIENFNNPTEAIQTVMRLYQSRPLNSGSLDIPVLSIPVEDYIDEEIPIDTTTSKLMLYSQLELNGTNYTDIISELVFQPDYITVYFSNEDGLIGFEDQFGIVWTRV